MNDDIADHAAIARLGHPCLRRAPRSVRLALQLAVAVAAAILMAGCGTTPVRSGPGEARAPRAASAPGMTAPGGGGYYLDDGPGAHPPPDLASIPDAVPRVEPISRAASRPYTVMGRTYVPMRALAPYSARGIASWYGRRYNGKQTASGERYDMYAMTAAHPTLPIPSYARVTNLSNGKSVVVRINDRGPFLGNRLIDLSYTAAYKLGILAGGSAMVEVDSIIPGVNDNVAAAPEAAPPGPDRSAERAIAALSAAPEAPADAPPAEAQAEPTAAPPPGGIFLQLGAFGSRDNAESYLAQLRVQVQWLSDRLQTFLRDGYYRVYAGPYASSGEARAAADRLAEALGTRPLLVTR